MSLTKVLMTLLAILVATIALALIRWDRIFVREMEPVKLLDSVQIEAPTDTRALVRETKQFALDRGYTARHGMNQGGARLYVQLIKEGCWLGIQQLGETSYTVDLYELLGSQERRCDDRTAARMLGARLSEISTHKTK